MAPKVKLEVEHLLGYQLDYIHPMEQNFMQVLIQASVAPKVKLEVEHLLGYQLDYIHPMVLTLMLILMIIDFQV
jgi:hypothetical protein